MRMNSVPECDQTCQQSEARKSCGENFCNYENMKYLSNWEWYKNNPYEGFVSRYDTKRNECTFLTLCATTPSKFYGMGHDAGWDQDDSGKLKESTCQYTFITVEACTHLKNQNGQLTPDE